MNATPGQPDDVRPDPMNNQPNCSGAGDFARWEGGRRRDADRRVDGWGARDEDAGAGPDEAEQQVTREAYAEHKRRFVEAGGAGQRFDSLRLLQAARIQANRMWSLLARSRGEVAATAPEREVRNSLDGLALEADVARSKGRLRAFVRRLWPFGTPWR